MIKPLEYYFMKKGIIEHVIFNKYTIDDCGVVRNKNTGKIVNTHKDGKYNRCGVYDNSGRRCGIRVCRAVASTFIGPPPSPARPRMVGRGRKYDQWHKHSLSIRR